jgi:hypothetical protein
MYRDHSRTASNARNNTGTTIHYVKSVMLTKMYEDYCMYASQYCVPSEIAVTANVVKECLV